MVSEAIVVITLLVSGASAIYSLFRGQIKDFRAEARAKRRTVQRLKKVSARAFLDVLVESLSIGSAFVALRAMRAGLDVVLQFSNEHSSILHVVARVGEVMVVVIAAGIAAKPFFRYFREIPPKEIGQAMEKD